MTAKALKEHGVIDGLFRKEVFRDYLKCADYLRLSKLSISGEAGPPI